jgi:hypothetical protein
VTVAAVTVAAVTVAAVTVAAVTLFMSCNRHGACDRPSNPSTPIYRSSSVDTRVTSGLMFWQKQRTDVLAEAGTGVLAEH